MCDEYSACQARTVRPVLAGQSDPLFEPARLLMTTPTPLTEVLAQENWLEKYKERVERLSQHDRLIKICTDAGFLKTIEVGQYFMTKDTEEFSQFTEPVTCREYTLPRDEKSTDPKDWIRGNAKIGPVLEVTTSCLQSKQGVEIRIESVNKDNSHSWVRISHASNKLVTDLIDKEYDDNEQETSETKSEEFALKTNVIAFVGRSNKAKQEDLPLLAHPRTVLIHERIWIDIEKIFRRGTWRKSEAKKEVIDEARTKGAKVHFASMMDICHLKNSELETKAPKIQRSSCTPRWYCKRRFRVLGFTEQGSSASQMTATKIMDIISRLPGCARQAADAVSAYTQVRMEDAHKLFKKIQNRSVQTFGFVALRSTRKHLRVGQR